MKGQALLYNYSVSPFFVLWSTLVVVPIVHRTTCASVSTIKRITRFVNCDKFQNKHYSSGGGALNLFKTRATPIRGVLRFN